MKYFNTKLWRWIWTTFVIVLVTLAFTAAFYLTGYIYGLMHLDLPALLVQIINSFLGLFLVGTFIGFFSRFFRQQQHNAFQPIIDALERIARGDFTTRLDDERQDSIISGLITSVNKMALELGQMENMRQEFISNVSHEIQSPLTSIGGFAQALRDDTLNLEERHHYLEIIETESNRLSRLADDLLKLASLEAEQVKFEPRPYRLDQQIRSIILTCEPQWRDKSLDVQVTLDEASIVADEDLLSQVWMNLVHNGIKFTPQGGTIKVSLHARGDQLEFRISDSGPGIFPEEQARVFERFYKADKSRTRSQGKGGSGLGLSIAKKIVEMHKGSIELQSAPGTGTTFIVILPVA